VDSWHPEYDYDLGASPRPYYAIGASLYRRDFTAGTVVVNASRATQTVRLGAVYLDESGARVTTVTLGPTRAAILRRAP
jgi:hypothetical protein